MCRKCECEVKERLSVVSTTQPADVHALEPSAWRSTLLLLGKFVIVLLKYVHTIEHTKLPCNIIITIHSSLLNKFWMQCNDPPKISLQALVYLVPECTLEELALCFKKC